MIKLLQEWQVISGAVVALFAASVTVWNVNRQVKAQAKLHSKREAETYQVIVSLILNLFQNYNLCWRYIDRALLDNNTETMLYGFHIMTSVWPDKSNVKLATDHSDFSTLSPLHKAKLNSLITWINLLENVYRDERALDETNVKYRLLHLRTMLSHLSKCAENVDINLSGVFDGRKMHNVDHRSWIEIWEDNIVAFEKQGIP